MQTLDEGSPQPFGSACARSAVRGTEGVIGVCFERIRPGRGGGIDDKKKNTYRGNGGV